MSGNMSEKVNPPVDGHLAKAILSRSARVEVAREIEENLKRVYQASLTEAVPDRFIQLLAQLREKEGQEEGKT